MPDKRIDHDADARFPVVRADKPWLERMLRPWARETTILLVEDYPDVRDVLISVLKAESYGVRACCDGFQCLELARTLRPDLIILNYLMPRMDGMTALRRLKRDPILSNLKVVMFSGVYDFERFKEAAIEEGALTCLQTPFNAETLLATVEGALRV